MQRTISLISCLLLALVGIFAQSNSKIAFTLSEKDLVPEGIAYDPVTKSFFISSTFHRKIVRIDRKGNASDFIASAQDGIWGVVGMKVDAKRRVLWAISSHAGVGMPMKIMDLKDQGKSSVHKYDLTTGKLMKKYELDNEVGHFLNDVSVNAQGDVFISDSAEKAIYQIHHEKDILEQFFTHDEMNGANGVTLSKDEKYLFIAYRGARFGRLNLADKTFVPLTIPEETMADGLYFYKNSLIAVSPWKEGKIIGRYYLNADQTGILKSEAIEESHPAMDQPTTGVIVGKYLYYIANSHLQTFRKMYQPSGNYATDQLRGTTILKVRLK